MLLWILFMGVLLLFWPYDVSLRNEKTRCHYLLLDLFHRFRISNGHGVTIFIRLFFFCKFFVQSLKVLLLGNHAQLRKFLLFKKIKFTDSNSWSLLKQLLAPLFVKLLCRLAHFRLLLVIFKYFLLLLENFTLFYRNPNRNINHSRDPLFGC